MLWWEKLISQVCPRIIAPSAADPELKPGLSAIAVTWPPELRINQDTGLRSEKREDLSPAALYELLAPQHC